MDFRDRVRLLRQERGMRQSDVADAMGLTNTAVAAWENGRSRPRLDKLSQLASLLGTTPYWLLNGDGPAEAPMEATSALVPVVGDTCMGGGDESEADRTVEVPAGVVSRHPSLFVVHGAGPCCNRRFPEDAALGVDPDAEPRTGDAVLARDEAHGSYVHVLLRGAGGTLMLSADSWDSGFPDIVAGPGDPPVEVIGTVVWWQAWEDVAR